MPAPGAGIFRIGFPRPFAAVPAISRHGEPEVNSKISPVG
jgi:hypothetical protein